jgi:hypothetical protein
MLTLSLPQSCRVAPSTGPGPSPPCSSRPCPPSLSSCCCRSDYLLSLTSDDALRLLGSPGKSGSVFFLSDDDRCAPCWLAAWLPGWLARLAPALSGTHDRVSMPCHNSVIRGIRSGSHFY